MYCAYCSHDFRAPGSNLERPLRMLLVVSKFHWPHSQGDCKRIGCRIGPPVRSNRYSSDCNHFCESSSLGPIAYGLPAPRVSCLTTLCRAPQRAAITLIISSKVLTLFDLTLVTVGSCDYLSLTLRDDFGTMSGVQDDAEMPRPPEAPPGSCSITYRSPVSFAISPIPPWA
jgi:hypothetical protein